MPKTKKKKQSNRNLTLTHNECRMGACVWCGKKRSRGSLQPISQKNLFLIQKYGNASVNPSSDDQLPKVICTSCRLGLSEFESSSSSGARNRLLPLFDWGYVRKITYLWLGYRWHCFGERAFGRGITRALHTMFQNDIRAVNCTQFVIDSGS